MTMNKVLNTRVFVRTICEAFEKRCFVTSAQARSTNVDEQITQPANPVHSSSLISSNASPLIIERKLPFLPKFRPPKQAWLETLSTIEDQKLGLINLHPDVFATYPRIDILHQNIHWQKFYKHIDYRKALTRAEVKGGGRKPWPQKGLGKARHGSIRSPIWYNGGKVGGPRGPKSYFYMLPTSVRALGLRVALSVKLAQNDLHIVDSLDMPSDEREYMEELMEVRGWGSSLLFVDDTDIMPRNITLSTDRLNQCNLMPVYGLNVHSILKHESLILTVGAVEKLEEKLLYQMHKVDRRDTAFNKVS